MIVATTRQVVTWQSTTPHVFYTLLMSRIRAAIAVVLAVAFVAAAPLTDWCAESCEAAGPAMPTAAAPCHHAASPTARIGRVLTPCGHDHHMRAVFVAPSHSSVRSLMSRVAQAPSVAGLSEIVRSAVTSRASPEVGSLSRSVPLALSIILRI